MARGGLPRGGGRGASGAGGGRLTRVSRGARRAWPVALEAWRRWDNLSPQQKERYKQMASEYGKRGRETLAKRRGGGGRRY